MSKAADIYWTSGEIVSPTPRRRTRRTKAVAQRRRTAPWWLSCLIVVAMFTMVGLSINFRAFTEMRQEVDQNTRLSAQIQTLVDENLALQQEIHSLKTDPKVIEREARRIGLDLRQEKVSVPAN